MGEKREVLEKIQRGAIVGMINDDKMVRLLIELMGNSAQIVNYIDVDLTKTKKKNPLDAVRKFIVEEITDEPREMWVLVEKLRMSLMGAMIACYQETRDEEYLKQ